MFIRRTFLCRYVVILSLVIYVIVFAGFLQMHQSPTLELDRSLLDAEYADRRPTVSDGSIDARLSVPPAAVIGLSTARATDRGDGDAKDVVPTPASVALALRSPLSMRNEDAPANVEKEPLGRSREADVQGISTTIRTSSTTTKKPADEADEAPAAKLDAINVNMTLHKANLSDVFRQVEAAKLGNDPKAAVRESARNSTVVNPHPFKYILNNPNVCQDSDIYVIAYVHTAPDHYKRRVVIRQTWGSSSNYDVNVRVIFVMGATANDAAGLAVQRAVEFEAEQYGDIVQEDFLDTYRNLTYKGIAALKWIEERCPHARWVLKTDDDIFVNTFNLMRHLGRLERLEAEEKATAEARHVTVPVNSARSTRGLLMCLVWYGMTVMREGKWKVDKADWPDDTYPTYCSGSAFVMSTDVAVALHRASYSVPFFWVDDFYVTGLLALRAGPSAVRHSQFSSSYVLDGRQLAEKFTGSQWYQYIFSHVHDLNAVQAVWKTVVRIASGDLKPTVAFARPDQLAKLAVDDLARKHALHSER